MDIKEENYEDDNMISICISLSDGDKKIKELSINDSKSTMKYDNNKK